MSSIQTIAFIPLSANDYISYFALDKFGIELSHFDAMLCLQPKNQFGIVWTCILFTARMANSIPMLINKFSNIEITTQLQTYSMKMFNFWSHAWDLTFNDNGIIAFFCQDYLLYRWKQYDNTTKKLVIPSTIAKILWQG